MLKKLRDNCFEFLGRPRNSIQTQTFKFLSLGDRGPYSDFSLYSLPTRDAPGEWMGPLKSIKMCRHGFHFCYGKHLQHWLSYNLYRVETGGATDYYDCKGVAAKIRFLSRVRTWNSVTARLWASDCAEAAVIAHTAGPLRTDLLDILHENRQCALQKRRIKGVEELYAHPANRFGAEGTEPNHFVVRAVTSATSSDAFRGAGLAHAEALQSWGTIRSRYFQSMQERADVADARERQGKDLLSYLEDPKWERYFNHE